MFFFREIVSTGPETWGDAGKQDVETAWTSAVRMTWDKFLNSLNFSSLIHKEVILICSSHSFEASMRL